LKIIDFSKVIFIVDSPLIAMMVAIIANKNPINVIYEFKLGIDDPQAQERAYDTLLFNTNIISKRKLSVPSPYFLINNKNKIHSIIRVLKFKIIIDYIAYREKIYSKKYIYFGPITSSLYGYIKKENKFTIDHGISEYEKRIATGKKKSIKRSFKEIIIDFFNLYPLKQITSDFGFTMCKIQDDKYTHVDYLNYEIPAVISEMLLKVEKFKGGTLLLPITRPHDLDGIHINTSNFDSINTEIIMKSCDKKERLIIKFHPSLYSINKPIITLVNILEDSGYLCLNIDACLPDFMKGNLPAEVIINFLNLKKIISDNSAIMFNVAHNKRIENFCTIEYLDKLLNRDNSIKNIINTINSKLLNKITLSNLGN